MLKITSIDHLVLTVADIGRTVEFYTKVLGMTSQSFVGTEGTERTALLFGSQKINLHAVAEPFAPHASKPMAGSADLCLLTNDPLQDWIDHFAKRAVELLEGPIARTGARGFITSLYLRDPDLNLIEISTYD